MFLSQDEVIVFFFFSSQIDQFLLYVLKSCLIKPKAMLLVPPSLPPCCNISALDLFRLFAAVH